MSTKFAFVSTLAGVLLLNGLAAGAITQTLTKDTKKHDKKPPVTMSVNSQRAEEHKKKDDEKKQELTAANSYQPALMKPASWRHFQQTHRHYRPLGNV